MEFYILIMMWVITGYCLILAFSKWPRPKRYVPPPPPSSFVDEDEFQRRADDLISFDNKPK